jgi:hypothetical protein
VVISNICNGRYSDSIRDLLLSNKGLALEKNPEPNPSWRPLGIGETLYRIAGSVVTSDPATKEAIVKHCGEFQLGLGKPSGTEAVPHIVLLSLLNPQPVAAIHVDVKNAFNTRSRASMLNTLFSQPELGKLWRLAHFRYKQPTKIFYQQASGSIALTLESREGCTQGDNLGTTLFDLDYSLDLEEALKADPSGEVTSCVQSMKPSSGAWQRMVPRFSLPSLNSCTSIARRCLLLCKSSSPKSASRPACTLRQLRAQS